MTVSIDKIKDLMFGEINLKKGVWVALIALSSLLISVMSSHLTDQVNQPTVLFWWGYISLCYLMLRIMQRREKQINQAASDAEASYLDKQDKLIFSIRTLPPPHALSNYTSTWGLINYAYKSLHCNPADQDERARLIANTEETLRYALNTLARFFSEYEHKPAGSVCAANLAIFIPMSNLNKDTDWKKSVAREIKYVNEPDHPFVGLRGVLHVSNELSGSSINEDFSNPDPDCEPIYLPIPTDGEPEDSIRSKYIPVAPRAFKHGRFYVQDLRTLTGHDQMDRLEVLPHVRESLKLYFNRQADSRIGSILAIRLDYDEVGPRPFPIAVLNLHSSQSVSKVDEAMVSAYIDLCKPLIELIKEMLVIRFKLLKQIGHRY